MAFNTPPNADQIEVSLFGPGYGEAIALHMGNGKWILVDSCTDPRSNNPLHLEYLRVIGVNPAVSVVHIVISHWHDDHVRGVSSVVQECSSAKVSLSNALGQKEFFALASVYDERPLPGGSGIDELVAVLRYLKDSGRPAHLAVPAFATIDRTLFQENLVFPHATVHASVFAVSPSDAATMRSKAAFALMFPATGAQPHRVAPITPNQSCVAILVEIGTDILLFGSDLEAGPPVDGGWSAVLASITVVGRVAGVFKVPHHGGASAHDNQVWANLLGSPPYAILTPFRKGGTALPSQGDISRIANLTNQAYVTGLPKTRRWQSTERVVEDMVKAAATSIVEVVPTAGQIRLRKQVNAPGWTVELFAGAQSL